jgi:hypothetical protein
MIGTKGLPAWNNAGVLPPIKPGMPGNSAERSPYIVDLITFVDVFSLSSDRIKLLDGFLRFRESLQKIGLTSGFQWLNGSFLENIELLENRPPHDLDVVNFYNIPKGETQNSLFLKNADLFNHDYLKGTFFIDGYFSALDGPVDADKIKIITYWYSMWSHRRNKLWKGFVQIDLDPSRDVEALTVLSINKETLQ